MDNHENQEKVSMFVSVTGTDPEFAASFLDAADWNYQEAVEIFLGGSGGYAAPDDFAAQAPAQPPQDMFSEDGVRAPILQKRARLFDVVGQSPPPGVAFDQLGRDFQGEARRHEALQFAMNMMGSMPGVAPSHSGGMFQAPPQLIFAGPLEAARHAATQSKRWVLINLQDFQEFRSSVLNRDLWSHDMIRDLVQGNFVFWQRSVDVPDGQHFLTLYNPPRPFPFVAILDPRTGELVLPLRLGGAEDELRTQFLDQVMIFLEANSLDRRTAPVARALAGAARPLASAHLSVSPPSHVVVEVEDDDDLEAAIQASLASASASSLTPPMSAPDQVMDEAPAPAPARFDPARNEPAADDADATKIRVRMPNGSSVVRRFLKQDPVSEIFAYVAGQLGHARFEVQSAAPNSPPLSLRLEETLASAQLVNAQLMVRLT